MSWVVRIDRTEVPGVKEKNKRRLNVQFSSCDAEGRHVDDVRIKDAVLFNGIRNRASRGNYRLSDSL